MTTAQTPKQAKQALEEARALYATLNGVSDLKTRAKVFADVVRNLYSFETIDEFGAQEREYLRGLKIASNTLGSYLSKAGYYKNINSILKIDGQNAEQVTKWDGKIELKHRAVRWFGLSNEEWDKRNSTDQATQRILADTEPLDPVAYLRTAYRLISSQEWREVAVGLIAATGRRPCEILYRGRFSAPITAENDWSVEFRGQAKKRDKSPVFRIAALLRPKLLMDALGKLRRVDSEFGAMIQEIMDEFGDVSEQNDALDRHFNKVLNRTVKEFFGSILPSRIGDGDTDSDKNNKALRACYAALAVKRDRKDDSVGGQQLYAACLLGHYTPDKPPTDQDLKAVLTTFKYLDIKIAGDVPFYDHKITKVSAHPECLEWINQKSEEWDCPQYDVIARLIEVYEQAAAPKPIERDEPESQGEQTDSDRKIALLTERIDQLTAAITSGKPAHIETSKPERAKPVTQSWAGATADELWGGNLVGDEGELLPTKPTRAPGAMEERIDRAVRAIMNRNDSIRGAKPMEKWAVTNRLVRDLTGANGQAIATRLALRWQQEIEFHHSSHGIEGGFHNRRYHGGLGEQALQQKAAATFWPHILDLNPQD